MLDILPFLAWLAAISSAVLLVVQWRLGDLGRRTLALLLAWFLVAAYLQFFPSSMMESAVGLLLQTVLAVGLSIHWKSGR